MAFDGLFCLTIAKELNKNISNYKIEKINCQSNSAEFSLYGEGKKAYLFISLSASANFVTVRDNPLLSNDNPSAFCLLLRKHLTSGRIKEVKAVENERIIKFTINAPDELGHISEKELYAEIMGKYSNLILASGGKILGSIYTADLVSYKRAIMPGLNYLLPPAQDKISARDIEFEKFASLCASSPDKEASCFLVDSFFCFSPLTAWEVVYNATGNGDLPLREVDSKKLYDSINALYSVIEEGYFYPTAVYKDENAVEFSFIDIHRYTGFEKRHFDTLCGLTSNFFSHKARNDVLKERTSDLQKLIANRIKRIEKKEALQSEELIDCQKKDMYKLYGELLTANLYRLKQGTEKAVCLDWNTGKEVEIPLDKRLSLSKNAENCFKKYRKYTNAEKVIKERLEESKSERDYLLSVLDYVNRCESPEEAEIIRNELAASGYLKKKDKKVQRKEVKPLEYKTQNGFLVRVGKNNIMNDLLTKSAGKNDIWFHVKSFPGSHVILYTDGKEPEDIDYTQAACIAAYHSSVRGDANIQVDYTRVKNVKKPSGSKPGFVIYDKYFTAVADGSRLPY